VNKKLLTKTFLYTSGATIYIFLVSQVMSHGNQWFGKEDKAFTPFVVLLLFSLSAAIVGSLVLGQSVLLFLDGKKNESVKATTYSIGWLAFYTILGLVILAIMKR